MPSGRKLMLLGVSLVLVAAVVLLFADRSPLPSDELNEGCVNWWCSRRNTIPVGFGMLLGGLGLIALLKASIAALPDADEHAPEPKREPHPRAPLAPRPRRRRP